MNNLSPTRIPYDHGCAGIAAISPPRSLIWEKTNTESEKNGLRELDKDLNIRFKEFPNRQNMKG